MSVISLKLPEADAARLAELAAREGRTPESIAAAAVRARLDADAAARAEIEAGLAELDAGAGMTLEAYEREMDAFMAELRSGHG
jgi:predicted transcriptional regulator